MCRVRLLNNRSLEGGVSRWVLESTFHAFRFRSRSRARGSALATVRSCECSRPPFGCATSSCTPARSSPELVIWNHENVVKNCPTLSYDQCSRIVESNNPRKIVRNSALLFIIQTFRSTVQIFIGEIVRVRIFQWYFSFRIRRVKKFFIRLELSVPVTYSYLYICMWRIRVYFYLWTEVNFFSVLANLIFVSSRQYIWNFVTSMISMFVRMYKIERRFIKFFHWGRHDIFIRVRLYVKIIVSILFLQCQIQAVFFRQHI